MQYHINRYAMKPILPLICLFTLLCNAPAANIFMGEQLSSTANMSSDDIFNAMLSTWMQDIQHSRKNGELCVCSNAEIAAARQAVNHAIFIARRACEAHMDFARYSLEPLRESKPGLHAAAEQQFRQALMVLLKHDMHQLRLRSVLCGAERHPAVQPREDAFSEALTARFSAAPTMRSDMVELQSHLNQLHQLRVNFIASLLAGDRPATEFLTNTQLENAPEDYAATCQAKFHAACSAWQQYMEAASRLHCPIPSLQGSSTAAATEACRQILQLQYEEFLTLLAGGLGS